MPPLCVDMNIQMALIKNVPLMYHKIKSYLELEIELSFLLKVQIYIYLILVIHIIFLTAFISMKYP